MRVAYFIGECGSNAARGSAFNAFDERRRRQDIFDRLASVGPLAWAHCADAWRRFAHRRVLVWDRGGSSLAERLRKALERASMNTGVGQLKATISLGAASLLDAASLLQELLARRCL